MHTAAAPPVLRYAAFTVDPTGGNPAGVVLDASGLDDAAMLAIAADLGDSESAFVQPAPAGVPGPDGRSFTLRYFSPQAEVAFCGHATVATAVALAERAGTGTFVFSTRAGRVPVTVVERADGRLQATLTSVEPSVEPVDGDDVGEAVAALGWGAGDLDPALPPRLAFAGVRHLVLAAASRARLADLSYDFDKLLALMRRLDLTTAQLVWRESPLVFHVRNPFPVGGVVEDPATGAAAAAFGAYLRELGLVTPPATVMLHQGEDMGRPSQLTVTMDDGAERIQVSGCAVRL